MIRHLKKLKTEQTGETLIIVALALTALIGIAALVVDIGKAYVRTAELQSAADAAVMAAGLQLPVDANDAIALQQVRASAIEYLGKNGIDDTSGVEVYLDELKQGRYFRIGVRAQATTQMGFARIFGLKQITFARAAEARTIPCIMLSDVVPLSVKESVLEGLIASGATKHVVLKYGKKTDEVVGGSFGAIDLDGVKGGGANDYRSWLANGYQGNLSVGDTLPVESGNMVGPTLSGISTRYNSCVHNKSCGGCNAEKYEPDCPRVMKVPVVRYTGCGNKYVEIVGFAAFVLEDYTTYSSQGYVIGTYVDMVNVGAAGGDLTGTAENYGVYSLTLSK
ncbi:MAG: pilus assembly protein TadG-related protein [Clostridia bacterium]